MLASILIGLDPFHRSDERMESVIRWGKKSGATLVGLGIIDEPGSARLSRLLLWVERRAKTRFSTRVTTAG